MSIPPPEPTPAPDVPATAGPAEPAQLAGAETRRILALDGLRGVAILMVILFHGYARWPAYTPWTTAQSEFFDYGKMGVELFFLISGFVVFLSLDKCASFRQFIFKRWLRLFPAMLIASAILYVTAFWLTERPAGIAHARDMLPGILFIEPFVLEKITHIDFKAMDGAFWSIFVEVKFYFIFGSLYFINKNKALYVLVALFLTYFLCKILQDAGLVPVNRSVLLVLDTILSLRYFGWFAIGALLYLAHTRKNMYYLCGSLPLLPLSVIASVGYAPSAQAFGMCIYLLFVLTLFSQQVNRMFSGRYFVLIGFISYPLYLIHQNSMIALTIKTHRSFMLIPDMLTPVPAIALLAVVAYAIAKYGEPLLRKALQLRLRARMDIPLAHP